MLETIIKTGILENASLNILLDFCSFSPATQEVYSHVVFIRKEKKLRISYSRSGKKGLSKHSHLCIFIYVYSGFTNAFGLEIF